MNPIFKYCLSAGIKPHKPKLLKAFFTKPFEKFIIVENSKNENEYENYEELIEYLHANLKTKNIGIVQLQLNSKDKKLELVDKVINVTPAQFCFLIEHSSLVITNNKLSAEFARIENKANILFSNQVQSFNQKPYWYPNDTFCFPTNSFSEKSAIKALESLNIKHSLDLIDPVFQGEHFNKKIIEIIPNFDVSEINLSKQSINIRADYFFDEKNILKAAGSNYCNIITNKKINLNKLPQEIIQKNLSQINFEINIDTPAEEINFMKQFNVPIHFFCRDTKNIQEIRLKFIDEQIDKEGQDEIKDLDKYKKLCDNYFYKSSKIIFSNKQVFTSLSAEKAGKPIQTKSIKLEKVYNEESFWREIQHYKLIQKKND